MAHIQHIAIIAPDPPLLADFYCKAFGMVEVFRQKGSAGKTTVYVTDGHVTVALIPEIPGKPAGLHHFGFKVDDAVAAANTAIAAGARPGRNIPRDGRFNELRVLDPSGVRVDLSTSGWATEPLDPAAAAARLGGGEHS